MFVCVRVYSMTHDSVVLCDLNSETLEFSYEGSKAREALTAAATHTDQQGITAGLLNDAVDPAKEAEHHMTSHNESHHTARSIYAPAETNTCFKWYEP